MEPFGPLMNGLDRRCSKRNLDLHFNLPCHLAHPFILVIYSQVQWARLDRICDLVDAVATDRKDNYPFLSSAAADLPDQCAVRGVWADRIAGAWRHLQSIGAAGILRVL